MAPYTWKAHVDYSICDGPIIDKEYAVGIVRRGNTVKNVIVQTHTRGTDLMIHFPRTSIRLDFICTMEEGTKRLKRISTADKRRIPLAFKRADTPQSIEEFEELTDKQLEATTVLPVLDDRKTPEPDLDDSFFSGDYVMSIGDTVKRRQRVAKRALASLADDEEKITARKRQSARRRRSRVDKDAEMPNKDKVPDRSVSRCSITDTIPQSVDDKLDEINHIDVSEQLDVTNQIDINDQLDVTDQMDMNDKLDVTDQGLHVPHSFAPPLVSSVSNSGNTQSESHVIIKDDPDEDDCQMIYTGNCSEEERKKILSTQKQKKTQKKMEEKKKQDKDKVCEKEQLMLYTQKAVREEVRKHFLKQMMSEQYPPNPTWQPSMPQLPPIPPFSFLSSFMPTMGLYGFPMNQNLQLPNVPLSTSLFYGSNLQNQPLPNNVSFDTTFQFGSNQQMPPIIPCENGGSGAGLGDGNEVEEGNNEEVNNNVGDEEVIDIIE